MTQISSLEEDLAWSDTQKSLWKDAPHAPVFVTVDAVVVLRKSVLLVRRARMPGIGRLALPGGHLEPDERLIDGAIRELIEETQISFDGKLYDPDDIKTWLAGVTVVDDPKRSIRGRTITHAFLFKLPSALRAPEVKGGDDAASATWHAIASLDPAEMFEDHHTIISSFLERSE